MISYPSKPVKYFAFLFLFLAILFEVAGTTSMKLSMGFTEVAPSACIFIFYTCSFAFLMLSLKYLPLSWAYAIWSGLGTLLIALVGILYFYEPLTIIKMVSLMLIVIGVMGLKSGN